MDRLTLAANGISFAALADGPPDGPLLLLLHGFPELARSWRHQLPALASAGFRAVAPDLRGYGESDLSGPYDLETLSADVAGLVRALGRRRAVVVGHDWGGAMAWATAVLRPEVVERLVVLSCPYPAVFAAEVVRNPRQLLRSAYMLFFQLPVLPDWTLARRGAAAVARALRGGSAIRSAWPREELDRYRAAFLRPGAASAALGYYRAAFRSPRVLGREGRAHPIAVPTLVVWGVRDRFLGVEMIARDRMAPFFAPGNAPSIVLVDEAGHFVQNEAPDRVNAALLGWLAPVPGRAGDGGDQARARAGSPSPGVIPR
ncbi:alpha/beta fold hydrolase [Anaeromyxobacter oryzae]|uniref:Alpha/beta hydrolase n=1 Tax=Anaeromyxobacter oryzae TaxID=2918170 RepID=A0ABN6MXM2_9BACT|nr:alpha/beta hydrolase [Anaeromyxobacter oryzae]BDG04425.1 alpha/beta hydrolase [Anaeromyxobacter oryzae]